MKQRAFSDNPLYNGHVDSVCVCVCVCVWVCVGGCTDPAACQKVLCSAVR